MGNPGIVANGCARCEIGGPVRSRPEAGPARVGPGGEPVRDPGAVNDFALRNLGFQVRYRYEFAPLSYLYEAYVRGGSLFQRGAGPYSVGEEFSEAFDMRDSEQLLVKLSYRFEI